MRDLWNEIVSSIGFVATAIIVIILFPMLFFAFMGMAGDPESLIGFLLGVIVVGTLLYAVSKVPTQEQVNKELWEKKEVKPDILKDRFGRPTETRCEYKERVHVRKREHFENITRNGELIYKYHRGYKNKGYPDISSEIGNALVNCNETSFMNTNLGMCHTIMVPHDRIRKMRQKNGAYTPYSVLEQVINERLVRHYSKSRAEIDQRGEEYGRQLRWASTYAILKAVYGKQRFFKIALSSDCEEYRIIYPFEVEPLTYNFNCTSEEEMKFIEEAFDRVGQVKMKKEEYHTKPITPTIENEVFKKYDVLLNDTWSTFHWSVDAEERLKEWMDELAEARKRREGIVYERET